MKFGNYLLHMLNKKNKSQTKFVCELQLKFDIFNALDEITFSRWVNNRTTPSLEKQLLIAHHFEKKMSFFVSNIEKQKCKKSVMITFNETFNKIENAYHKINYKSSLESEKTLYLMHMNKETHRLLLGDFYTQFQMYQELFSHIDKERLSITTTVFAIKKHGEIISHVSYNQNVGKLIPDIKKELCLDNSSDSISINIGYYSNKENYSILIGHLFSHLIDKFMSVKDIYIISNGRYFIDFLEELGGEIVIFRKEKKHIGDIYIFKFNFTKLLSNPFMFNQIKYYYHSYIELNKNLVISL